jgi:acetylornithine/succinyldiaminopimelate/putrescine aminotransferase
MKFNRFRRTGKLLIQNYDVVPDIVVMGKGMGGGMPVGALPHQPK